MLFTISHDAPHIEGAANLSLGHARIVAPRLISHTFNPLESGSAISSAGTVAVNVAPPPLAIYSRRRGARTALPRVPCSSIGRTNLHFQLAMGLRDLGDGHDRPKRRQSLPRIAMRARGVGLPPLSGHGDRRLDGVREVQQGTRAAQRVLAGRPSHSITSSAKASTLGGTRCPMSLES
jgi:hypothetical protein